MRRCNICKKQASDDSWMSGDKHVEQCPYYWALIGANRPVTVDGDTCFIEDTEGCPDRRDGTAELNCPGCIECDIDS